MNKTNSKLRLTNPSKKPSYWKEFIPKSWIYLSRNYSWTFFKGDFVAGITVGIISLPLAMAFAMASGLTPERGIYTTIVAGFLISLLGGSRLQIGGPTGAFVVIIFSIVERFGYDGLVLITLLAGVILILAALFRLGNLIKYIPYPLITGFTTGIALVIFSSQIKDFFGLQLTNVPTAFVSKWFVLIGAFPTLHLPTCLLAGGTLLFIVGIRRYMPIIPWGIAGVVLATIVSISFNLPVETIASRYGEIERSLPSFSFPSIPLSFVAWKPYIPEAVTVAFLAGIEALLSAIVADGMAGGRHKSNCELLGQGLANIGSVFFGESQQQGRLRAQLRM